MSFVRFSPSDIVMVENEEAVQRFIDTEFRAYATIPPWTSQCMAHCGHIGIVSRTQSPTPHGGLCFVVFLSEPGKEVMCLPDILLSADKMVDEDKRAQLRAAQEESFYALAIAETERLLRIARV